MLPPQGLSSSPSFAFPGRGDLLAGRYRVERKLGAGGMGLVVAALDEQMGVHVAVKLLLPEAPSPSPAFQHHDESGVLARSNRHHEMSTRLIREASAAARLSSEHVTRVLDVGRLEHGDPYVVMELLEGVDLGRYAKARGPLPVVEAVTLVLQACEAIVEAHSLGIVHRDLKPANLFLTRRADGSPFVKVLDFGISKVLGNDDNQLTGTTDMLGSPLYMAPEQIRSARDVDARADVWSLGTILYRLLAGRAAFEAQGSAATLAAIISDAPHPLRALRPDVPAELEYVVLRCLEKDCARRIQSVRELASLLAPFAQGATGTFPRVPSGAYQHAASLPASGSSASSSSSHSFPASGASVSSSASQPSAGLAMPGHAAFTPPGGLPSMTSVAPSATTVSGRRGRTGAVAAVLVGLVVAVTAVAVGAWKLLGSTPEAAAGGEAPLSGAAAAAASISPAQAASAGPSSAPADPPSSAPSTPSAEPTAAADTPPAVPTAAASAPAATTSTPAPVKPKITGPIKAKDDPLGDRL